MIKIPKVTEATALGAAMAAGVGAGVYPSVAQASELLVMWDKTFYPNLSNKMLYNVIQEKWGAVYRKQLSLV